MEENTKELIKNVFIKIPFEMSSRINYQAKLRGMMVRDWYRKALDEQLLRDEKKE